MGGAFTIPSIYTVIDKFTSPLKRMMSTNQSFADSASAGIAKQERLFRKFTPLLSEASKQFLSFASAAAIAGGILMGINFSINAVKDYEDALASFRTIVGGTNAEFKKYSDQSLIVAKNTKSSAVDVVKAFESIAGLNSSLAKTPEALGAISEAAIIMARGSGDDLQKSAENLVGIMNQFNYEASQADRVINVLAAGQAVGASSISKTADAFTVFGAVAKTANIEVEEATALVQVLGSKMVMGSEAGTALRSTIGLLQKSGFGYKNGLFDINQALEEAKKKYDSLSTAKKKDAFIAKTFGEINKSTGTILLTNIEQFKQFTKAVGGTSEAQKAAELKSTTLTAKLDQLKAAWVNQIVGSDQATSSLHLAKQAIGFVTDNLGTLISIGTKVILFFIIWKALILASKVALTVYNVVLGITTLIQGKSALAIRANTVAFGAYKAVLGVVTAAQWLLNAALTANPIGIIIVAIGLLIGMVTLMITKWDEWGAALALFMGPLGMIVALVQTFRSNWDAIRDSFSSGNILLGIALIGKTITEAILYPIQQVLQLIAKFTGAQWATNAVQQIEAFKTKMEIATAVNPKADQQNAMVKSIQENNNTSKVEWSVNDPYGFLKPMSSDDNNMQPKLGGMWSGSFGSGK